MVQEKDWIATYRKARILQGFFDATGAECAPVLCMPETSRQIVSFHRRSTEPTAHQARNRNFDGVGRNLQIGGDAAFWPAEIVRGCTCSSSPLEEFPPLRGPDTFHIALSPYPEPTKRSPFFLFGT